MKKSILAVMALVCAFAVLTPRASAINREDAVMSKADQSAFSAVVFGGATSSNMMTLFYIGTATESLATITSSNITFYAPFGTVDSNIGSSGVVDLTAAAYDTMGELCDYINSTSYHRCVLTGALRSDPTSGANAVLQTQTATSGDCNLKSQGGCTITNVDASIVRLGIIPQAGKRVILKGVQAVSVETTNNVDVYGVLRKYAGSLLNELGAAVSINTRVWRAPTGSTSLVYVPASSQYQLAPWLEFANYPGYAVTAPPVGAKNSAGRVVVSMGVAGGTDQTSSQYLRVFWDEK